MAIFLMKVEKQLQQFQLQILNYISVTPMMKKSSTSDPKHVKLSSDIVECQKYQDQQEDESFDDITTLMSRMSNTEQMSRRSEHESMDNFQNIMDNNKIWAEQSVHNDPNFFKKLVNIQEPQFLWIGCSDSRVPANQIVGLKPGELFVHRNVANQCPPTDINALAVLQYAVQVLKVKDIIIAGHYGCGGIKAAFQKHDHGPLEAWLFHIRDLRARYKKKLTLTHNENVDLLTQYNVKHQVYNVARIPIVQKAWQSGQQLRIHGVVYKLDDGILRDLGLTLSRIEHLPEQFRIYDCEQDQSRWSKYQKHE